ncbi:hypothetical protein O6H91_01G086800 [Diphasiastrum complanatum]|uniref:Uncharacterized protein n=1 Tax=Diphasiastrum complanatum TaxID=34168 RepID=A0ACC2ET99_DIPCM|nr:hypothetical protein O6H91_01G086800 [Diphasiastrum complanatum]
MYLSSSFGCSDNRAHNAWSAQLENCHGFACKHVNSSQCVLYSFNGRFQGLITRSKACNSYYRLSCSTQLGSKTSIKAYPSRNGSRLSAMTLGYRFSFYNDVLANKLLCTDKDHFLELLRFEDRLHGFGKVIERRISSSNVMAIAAALPEGATEADAEYMKLCVKLARKAVGRTSPNPMVGCVIVKNGGVIGQGFHPRAGEPHAEVFALREAGGRAEGSTVYVSLEPCNHFGRTPPCSQALIRAKVKRVVVGMVDPNPQVGGKGIETLRKSGIEVVVGVEEELCQATNEAFVHRMLTGKPFVCLRFSMSLDGRFLGSRGQVVEFGSSFSQQLQEYNAVVITDAAVFDDPTLLSSEAEAKQPLRIILARSLDMPLESKVFDTSHAPTLVLADAGAVLEDVQSNISRGGQSMESLLLAKGVDVVTLDKLHLDMVLDLCNQRGLSSVLLDSRGPDMSGLENFLGKQAIQEGIVQKLVVDMAPVICGDLRATPGFQVQELIKLEKVRTCISGGNVLIEGYLPGSD